MARTNIPRTPVFTHEGAKAKHVNPQQLLRRSVMACLLWEDEFYEEGVGISERIKATIPLVSPELVAQIAVEARNESQLRHIPLFIVREMARLPKHKALVAETLPKIIQRADELTEFVALYWKDKRQPLSAGVKKGLAKSFTKFNEYHLAKYNRPNAITLRDVLFLCHAKPKDKDQEDLWKRLVDGKLATPDTWEVALSAGEGPKDAIWTRLLKEHKLGALALIRNIRNMTQAGVDEHLIKESILKIKPGRTLPFRFIASAQVNPRFEQEIEVAMLRSMEQVEKLPGKTVLMVDVSGSMAHRLSFKSDINRMDAASGLAILAREICQDVAIITFSDKAVFIPSRHGFALRDAIGNSQPNSGTHTGAALEAVRRDLPDADRTIIITDEQSHDRVGKPIGRGYVINVGSCENGIGYGEWVHIDGWSESVLKFIKEYECEPEGKEGKEGSPKGEVKDADDQAE